MSSRARQRRDAEHVQRREARVQIDVVRAGQRQVLAEQQAGHAGRSGCGRRRRAATAPPSTAKCACARDATLEIARPERSISARRERWIGSAMSEQRDARRRAEREPDRELDRREREDVVADVAAEDRIGDCRTACGTIDLEHRAPLRGRGQRERRATKSAAAWQRDSHAALEHGRACTPAAAAMSPTRRRWDRGRAPRPSASPRSASARIAVEHRERDDAAR